MNKEKREIVLKLLSMPRDFYTKGNVSEWQLIQESGYIRKQNEISLEDIKNILSQNISYIEDWITLSEDKRVDKGWYIEQKESGFEVGYYAQEERSKRHFFTNIIEACSLFIKNNIDDMILIMSK